ncbi:MAG: hypothetical protein ACKON9_04810 [Planctomycetaceae bacterium]
MTWFTELTGCLETSPDDVRQQLWVEADRLHSRANGGSWRCGTLVIPSLAELRQQSQPFADRGQPVRLLPGPEQSIETTLPALMAAAGNPATIRLTVWLTSGRCWAIHSSVCGV